MECLEIYKVFLYYYSDGGGGMPLVAITMLDYLHIPRELSLIM